MNSLDIVDIYNENKEKVGYTKVRYKDTLELGEYIIGVQAIIINSKKEILISKRSENKKAYPSMWECNGGAITTGETSIQSIVREIKEELGIDFREEDAILIKTIKKENQFKDLYLFVKDINVEDIRFQDNEATEVKWVNIDKFIRMYQNNEIVPNVDFGREEYEICLNIIEKI